MLALNLAAQPAEARCIVTDEICRGCGCKGGPGYREISTNRCVGFRDLRKRCGEPPSPAGWKTG